MTTEARKCKKNCVIIRALTSATPSEGLQRWAERLKGCYVSFVIIIIFCSYFLRNVRSSIKVNSIFPFYKNVILIFIIIIFYSIFMLFLFLITLACSIFILLLSLFLIFILLSFYSTFISILFTSSQRRSCCEECSSD